MTALDIDPAHVSLARQFVADRGLHNVEVFQSDALATGLPCGSFDLVHARLLLVNIPSPEQVIAEMVRLVKPGGWVVTDEADAGGAACAIRPTEAWDQLRAILHERVPFRGRRLVRRPEVDGHAAGRRASRGGH